MQNSSFTSFQTLAHKAAWHAVIVMSDRGTWYTELCQTALRVLGGPWTLLRHCTTCSAGLRMGRQLLYTHSPGHPPAQLYMLLLS